MFRIALAAISSKVAVGTTGALLAGAMTAGTITGTVALTSNESDILVETVDKAPTTVVEDPAAGAVGDIDDVEGGEAVVERPRDEGKETKAPTEPVDLSTVPVPTSVSEAAKTHAFDEACGNHGKYVSHFARSGEEPDCATSARTAAASDAGAGGTRPDATLEEESTESESAPKAKAEKKAEKREKKAEKKAQKREAKVDKKAAKRGTAGS